MLTSKANQQLISQLFDNQPDGVAWYRPVFESTDLEAKKVIDFELAYCNCIAARNLGISPEDIVFTRLLTSPNMEETFGERIFEQCLKVWKTGDQLVFDYYSPELDCYFNVQRSKVANGVLSIIRDRTKEIKVEAKRKDQERKYQQILDTAADGIMLLDAIRGNDGEIVDFKISLCNKRGVAIGQLSPDSIGKSLLEVFPHLENSEQLQLHKKVVETGEPERFETTFRTAKGNEYGWFIVSLTKLGDGVISNFVDVTERKQHEQKIEEQKDMLNSIFEASTSSVFACEAVRNVRGEIIDFLIVKVNKAFSKISSKKVEELEEKNFLSLFPNAIEAGVFKAYCNVIETGKSFFNQMYYNGEGLDGWFEVSVVKRGKEGLVINFTDVTENVKNKLQLEKAAAHLQQIIDVAPTGIFTLAPVMDNNGAITSFCFTTANSTLAAYVDQEANTLIGKLHDEWFPGYKAIGVFDIYKQIFETGESARFECHYKDEKLDGWLDVIAKKVDGEILVSFHDFTKLKNLQLQLESTVEELKQSNASLEEYAYAASHDLKEPVRKIYTFSDRLKIELTPYLNPNQERMFERMQSAAQRMRRLIEDLLTYSDVNQKQREFEGIELNVVVQEVKNDLETLVLEKKADVIIETLPVIRGNKQQLHQLFQNLLSNSLKYAKDNIPPYITITSRLINNDEAKSIFNANLCNASYYLIEVKDNGIGFDQEHAEKIFQVFQRLHGQSEYEGTGVGLAIAQRVVINHKGHIKAEGITGVGAAFKILFPA